MASLSIAAKRKKPPRVFDHIEIRGQAGGAVIEQHFTSEEHEPQSYEVRTHPVARIRAVQTGVCNETSRDALKAARGQSEEASFTRRKQRHGPQDPAWAKSGLFRPGFNIGPLLRGAKLFTKGKAKE